MLHVVVIFYALLVCFIMCLVSMYNLEGHKPKFFPPLVFIVINTYFPLSFRSTFKVEGERV